MFILDPKVKKTVDEKRKQINRLLEEIKELSCPFKVGDIIERQEGYMAGKYLITQIDPFCSNPGFVIIGRKYGIYGQLTLLHRELFGKYLDGFKKIGEKE